MQLFISSSTIMTTRSDQAVLECMFSPIFPFGYSEEHTSGKSQASDFEEESEDINRIKMEAIKAAENGRLAEAVELLTMALAMRSSPSASLYNDRAQVLQLLGNTDGALEDLEKVIELTKGRGQIAGKALVQRGTIFQFRGDESAALRDYKEAAELGNEFAKRQLVLLNPMAAMCNKMLSEVMKKMSTGEGMEQ